MRLGRVFRERGREVDLLVTEEKPDSMERFTALGITVDYVDPGPHPHPLVHSYRVGKRLRAAGYRVVFLNRSIHAQAALGMLPDEVVAIPIVRSDSEWHYSVDCANRRAWNAAIGISPKVCNEIRSRIIDRPVLCIPNCVEIPTADILANRSKLSHPIQIVYVGRLSEPQKGICYLPEIMKVLKRSGVEYHLSVVGSGEHESWLKNRVRQYSLEGLVTYLGEVDLDHVYQKLLRSHILVFPSRFEGLGNVALEAQACGCVPVASRLRGVTDVTIDEGRTGLLAEVGDVQQFASAIKRIASSPSLWESMSEAGRQKVAEQFSMARLSESYNALVDDVLQGKYSLPHSRRAILPINPRLFPFKEHIPRRLRRFRHRLLSLVRR